jgi:hypothetical protein
MREEIFEIVDEALDMTARIFGVFVTFDEKNDERRQLFTNKVVDDIMEVLSK